MSGCQRQPRNRVSGWGTISTEASVGYRGRHKQLSVGESGDVESFCGLSRLDHFQSGCR